MNCSEYKRARRPEQKKERMQEIEDAVDRMFHDETYHDITLTNIAENMGMSRGNLYKYVTTVEEIFMSLYLKKQCQCMTDIMNTFFECDMDEENVECPEGDYEKYECSHFVPKSMSNEKFAKTLAGVFTENIDLFKYHDILGCIIETNVPVDKLAEFEKNMESMRYPICLAIKTHCPKASDCDLKLFYRSILYQGCGLYNQTHKTKNLTEALALANLPVDDVDFENELYKFILIYLNNYTTLLEK
ncbi:MAG: TetR/AcrR family transcriptional regulator [Lachnospiraceae bacterium]|nr:TetR/AcrR family transcriptional regulator [Lachnospiraceae bacterium]